MAGPRRAGGRTTAYLPRHGRPIRYGYLHGELPARRLPERVRRPSRAAPRWPAPAGRSPSGCSSRSWRAASPSRRWSCTPGVSSPELHEPPYPERFAVPEATARLVTAPARAGGRVVAVGTTVTRALETATDDDGVPRAAAGWTDLVLGPDRPARVVTGLVTGLHVPEASHLQLLEAVAGPALVARRTRRPSPSTTSGTSSATRCCSCPEPGRLGPVRPPRAGPAAPPADDGGTRCTSAGRAPRTSRQHDARRVKRARPTSTYRGAGSGVPMAAASGAASRVSAARRRGAARGQAPVGQRVRGDRPQRALAHPAGPGDRADHRRQRLPQFGRRIRTRARTRRPRPAAPRTRRTREIGRPRRQRPAGGQPGERRGQQHRGDRVPPHRRGHPQIGRPSARARAATSSAVPPGSASEAAGTDVADGRHDQAQRGRTPEAGDHRRTRRQRHPASLADAARRGCEMSPTAAQRRPPL